MHLIVDGYGGNVDVMQDHEALFRFLDEYPDAIGMTKITSPQVYTYNGQKPEDNGISGFVLIAESHISIHTFPYRNYINIDIFSCKEFDAEQALDELRAVFSLEKIRSWVLERGLEYSDVETAARQVDLVRSNLMGRL